MSNVRANHTVIKCSWPDGRLQDLKAHCRQSGTTVSDFLRESAMGALQAPASLSALPQGPDVYSKAVEAAARASAGIPRQHLETITAAVINSLYASTTLTR